MKNLKVLQPMRFADAHYNFSPIQRDFIMMVQYKTYKQEKIKSDFKIDIKPYFKAKGINLENIRNSHYDKMCEDLISAKIGFQYFKGNTLFSYHNLFSSCSINKDLILSVSIIDDVLPLFYINKLNEGHFKDNKLVKKLFEKSYPEFDPYVSYLPKAYIKLKEGSEKKLFEKLLQYRTLGEYTFDFSKKELYLLLGYGFFIEKPLQDQQLIFNITEYDFKETKYIGSNGWKNFRKKLNKWLETINKTKDTDIEIIKKGKSYFVTKGRPVRSIQIQVKYSKLYNNYSGEEKESALFLEKFKLSDKQIYNIVTKYSFDEIKKGIHSHITAMKDNGRRYYGEFKHPNYREISNLPGYIYSKIFKLG